MIEQSKQELSEELREEVDHVKQLTKEQLEEELQMLEKEKLLVEQFGRSKFSRITHRVFYFSISKQTFNDLFMYYYT